MILQYFWPHKASVNAELEKLLGHNYHKERRNHQSQDVIIINEMILKYYQILHQLLTMKQHDNKAYFDGIIQNLTTICNQK